MSLRNLFTPYAIEGKYADCAIYEAFDETTGHYVARNGTIGQCNYKSIAIPLICDIDDSKAIELLLHAAMSRNTVIFDSQQNPYKITSRLMALSIRWFRSLGANSRLTDILVGGRATYSGFVEEDINVHQLTRDENDYLRYYYKSIGGTFPSYKNPFSGYSPENLMVLMDTRKHFVRPVLHSNSLLTGLAVLDERSVLLAAY